MHDNQFGEVADFFLFLRAVGLSKMMMRDLNLPVNAACHGATERRAQSVCLRIPTFPFRPFTCGACRPVHSLFPPGLL